MEYRHIKSKFVCWEPEEKQIVKIEEISVV